MKKKSGGVELLRKDHRKKQNPYGAPVLGWQQNSQGLRGRHNPRGFSCPWVVVQKEIEGKPQPLYEQPMIVENAGAIIIAQQGERVGLIRSFRMTGPRLLPDAGTDYIQRLDREQRWEELCATLGQWRWEAPRGLAPADRKEDEDIRDFVLRTAKLEALEEAGFTIGEARIIGRVNVNPTFFPHPQWVVHAEVISTGPSSPENLEIIDEEEGARFFTMAELRELSRTGEFDDGLTLGALALCGLALPPL